MFQGYQQLEKRYSKSPDGGNEFRSNMNINGSQLRSSGASRQKNKNLPKLVKQCWLSNPVYRERDGAARGGEGWREMRWGAEGVGEMRSSSEGRREMRSGGEEGRAMRSGGEGGREMRSDSEGDAT